MRVSRTEVSEGLRASRGAQVWWAAGSPARSLLIHAGSKVPRTLPLRRTDAVGTHEGFVRCDIWCSWRARGGRMWVSVFDDWQVAGETLCILEGMTISEVEVHGDLNDLRIKFAGDDDSTAVVEVFCDKFDVDTLAGPNWSICVGDSAWAAETDRTLTRTSREPP